MESTLFVPENLSFSENLRCLNLPLLVGALSQKRSLSLTCFVFAGQNVHSGKFKHLKYSENDKFSGTNSVDSILVEGFLRTSTSERRALEAPPRQKKWDGRGRGDVGGGKFFRERTPRHCCLASARPNTQTKDIGAPHRQTPKMRAAQTDASGT